MYIKIISSTSRLQRSFYRSFTNTKNHCKVTLERGDLPPIRWKFHNEFSSRNANLTKLRMSWATSKRISKIVLETVLFEPRSAAILTLSALGVYLLGFYEASLLLRDNVNMSDSLAFELQYALHQMFPSLIWNTVPADLVALACNLDPDNILRVFDSTSIDASRQLSIQHVQTFRSVTAGFLYLGQLLRIVNLSINAGDFYRKQVLLGQVPPLDVVNGKVIRLAGLESDVTALSMKRMGLHVLPIYENPKYITRLIRKHSKNGSFPVFWHIPANMYGNSSRYEGLDITDNWLIKSATGRSKMLYMEADTTNPESSFQLGASSNDLSVEDASQGFRMLIRRANQTLVHRSENRTASSSSRPLLYTEAAPQPQEKTTTTPSPEYHDDKIEQNFNSFRVLLGDLNQKMQLGSGKSITLRQRIESRNDADVLLDSQAPILQNVLDWCRDAASNRGAIVFETDQCEHFNAAKDFMFAFGYTLYDSDRDLEIYQDSLKLKPTSVEGIDPPVPMARLIYYRTTSASVNAALSLVELGLVDPSRCCVLVDKALNLDILEEIKENYSTKFRVVCAAQIYDDMFREVRGLASMGYPASRIQREFDQRFQKIYDIIDVKRLAESSVATNSSSKNINPNDGAD